MAVYTLTTSIPAVLHFARFLLTEPHATGLTLIVPSLQSTKHSPGLKLGGKTTNYQSLWELHSGKRQKMRYEMRSSWQAPRQRMLCCRG